MSTMQSSSAMVGLRVVGAAAQHVFEVELNGETHSQRAGVGLVHTAWAVGLVHVLRWIARSRLLDWCVPRMLSGRGVLIIAK